MTPKVSVCISVYNHAQYIVDCLNSIVSQQTNFDFEVIVGEDCSTDESREIILQFAKEYPDMIKPVLYEKNVGSSANYNYIHSIAKGEYVAHIDGDDLFLPGKLQKQADFLDMHPDYSVTWHKVVFFDDEGHRDHDYKKKNVGEPGETITLEYVLRNGTVAPHCSIMYRRSAKKTFNPDFLTLDLFFTVEFLMSGKGMILNDVLGMYRVMSATSVSKGKKGKLAQSAYVISHWNYFRKILPQYRSHMFIFATVHFFIDFKNRRSTAWGMLGQMLLNIGPFSPRLLIESFYNTKYLRLPVSFFNKPK